MSEGQRTITVNGRSYAWPGQPVVVVCIDGSQPEYIDQAIAAGRMPYLEKALAAGTSRLADCVLPAFTNPNNISIVTGVPPRVHGISGNFFFDPDSGEEIMMNEPHLLRAETIFSAFAAEGAKIAIVTAKDKLRRLLGHGLSFGESGHICFSSEKADSVTPAENGISGVLELVGQPLPSVYSAELSEFVFAAGVKLLAGQRPDLMYLSTTDYVQHKHGPGTPVANDFYAMMDGYLDKLDALGATLAMTADHGMNDKFGPGGEPDVIYLQDVLDEWLGTGAARVILPITDPYVVHHGALGSFATAYLPAGCDVAGLTERLRALEGMELVLGKSEGCARFELPEDRLGDLILVSGKHKVLGTSVSRHDLSALEEPLRSHGGLSEQRVPLLLNRPTPGLEEGRALRNFDAFDLALNYAR
ncbi:MAG: phosphonoacetate hydrolase [SAR324 cluster bacterium]|nr:phosphonoacetate hydrolase [SAR324 cluster bacterium]